MSNIGLAEKSRLHLDLRPATYRPVDVEGVSAFPVDPLVGMSPEEVALPLQQVCGEALTTVAIVI